MSLRRSRTTVNKVAAMIDVMNQESSNRLSHALRNYNTSPSKR